MDKGIRHLKSQWELDTWQVRGHQVDPYPLPTGLGGKKRKRGRKREKERAFRERSSTFSLDFPMISSSNSGETRGKVDPPLQELRVGTDIMEFRQLQKGRGFLLLDLFYG